VSQSPTSSASSSQILEYDKAWAALNLMIREGRGFSGHERNCSFLNLAGRDQRFANVSSATGLDFDDDGRGLASVDWDGDGDLDFWITNRTGPAVRYIRNDLPSGNPGIAFLLQGTTANRSGIGARIELYLGDDGATRRIKTLRAGHGHLSQSSPWVHFGLGTEGPARHVIVKWPGGAAERFDLSAGDTARWRLVQGSGRAEAAPARPPLPVFPATTATPPAESDAGRIVILRPAPVPDLVVTDLEGTTTSLVPVAAAPSKPLLVNLWATWCAPCVKEMGEWTAQKDRLAAAGLDIVSVSVDDDSDPADRLTKVRASLQKSGYPFRVGFPADNLIERLETLQRSFIGRQSALPIPSSFLIDARGRLAVIYRGPVTVERLLADLALLDQPLERVLAGAVPFPGSWLGQPKPTEPRAVAIKFLNRGSIQESEAYIRRLFAWHEAHPGAFSEKERNDLQSYLGAILFDQKRYADALAEWQAYIGRVPGDRATIVDMARAWTALKQPDRAAEALRQALRMKRDDPELLAQLARSLVSLGGPDAPREAAGLFRESLGLQPSRVVQFELAQVLGTSGRIAEAIGELRSILAAHPAWPPAVNNLAWLLATGPDAALRDGAQAVQLAETVRNPDIVFTLGTLSAAYAEAGRLDDALRTIREAIALEESKTDSPYLADFRAMLATYEAGQPHRDPKLGQGNGS
jgi:tetratricopeptide (TPR) repeat protein